MNIELSTYYYWWITSQSPSSIFKNPIIQAICLCPFITKPSPAIFTMLDNNPTLPVLLSLYIRLFSCFFSLRRQSFVLLCYPSFTPSPLLHQLFILDSPPSPSVRCSLTSTPCLFPKTSNCPSSSPLRKLLQAILQPVDPQSMSFVRLDLRTVHVQRKRASFILGF